MLSITVAEVAEYLCVISVFMHILIKQMLVKAYSNSHMCTQSHDRQEKVRVCVCVCIFCASAGVSLRSKDRNAHLWTAVGVSV